MHKSLKLTLIAGTALVTLATAAAAEQFNIPAGDLKAALDVYARQTGTQLLVSTDAVKGVRTRGVQGDMGADAALSHLLSGTGFKSINTAPGTIGLMPNSASSEATDIMTMQLAQASPTTRSTVETVTVTSSKLGGADVQSIPISITAMSQEQLTATQTTGGPDLVKQVPNLNFSKTNFSGYNIQIRGIGTQAVSVATDPAVAVAFNDTAFIRNHFFEQEFFDVSQVEVLRGPQGTLYGRNATAGVVNLVSAKPTDQYEAQASVDIGNYENRRLEGMLNIPVIGDKLDVRLAGEWTKREGYDYNLTTQNHVNGRDLFSTRLTVGFMPIQQIHGEAIWEHFSENDDRSRTGKQLCTRDPGVTTLGDNANLDPTARDAMSQGCLPGSLYAPAAFGTPNGRALNFVLAASGQQIGRIGFLCGAAGDCASTQDPEVDLLNQNDPYGNARQSTNLREIASIMDPKFRAKNDTFEFNFDVDVTPELTVTSQTGYNHDSYYSTQDYNRFNTFPVFNDSTGLTGFFDFIPSPVEDITPGGVFCDPQLGCSSSIVGFDISQAKSWQFSQEVRLASNFSGPLNFSVGANYTRYHTVEDYYVLFNVITAIAENIGLVGNFSADPSMCGVHDLNASISDRQPMDSPACAGNIYIDTNPLSQINGDGHNYFRSKNPYTLNSWAGFGEAYYQLTSDIKLTAGVRYTSDNKDFTPVPSQLLLSSQSTTGGTVDRGYPSLPDIQQHWGEFTGRLNAQWTPKIEFTDQSMFYASYSRGYKGGGANPPGIGFSTAPFLFGRPLAQVLSYSPTFKPEFVNAYEAGTKNTLFGGALVLNGDVFYYDYKDYQISQIRSRTAVNENFNAKIWGSELEATWEPLPGLRFNFAGGYESSSVGDNQLSIDPMDRIQGHTDYTVLKPFLQLPDNCVVLKSVVEQFITINRTNGSPDGTALNTLCPGSALFNLARYPVTPDIGLANPNYPFDPVVFPNQGQGFFKNVGGNDLPNTPPFTLSLGAQYTMPISSDWVGTLRGDGYWQGNSFARIYNDKPYDQIHAYTNLNLALIFTNQDGWQAMAYLKNVFDTTAITGTFLNSDDTALTTNIFTTDPRLFGIRVTKNW
jgi:outer membrane receptor protein involved in Fe transport